MVADVLDGLRKNGEQGDAQVEASVRERVARTCARASRSIRRIMSMSKIDDVQQRRSTERLRASARSMAKCGARSARSSRSRCPFVGPVDRRGRRAPAIAYRKAQEARSECAAHSAAHEDSQVKDSRPTEDGAAIRRRRQCEGCAARFTTFERIQLRELTVLKSEDRREPFDRDKLLRSVVDRRRKRPIDAERIDQLVSGIQRQLETQGESEIPSQADRRDGDGRAEGRSTRSPISASPASIAISARPRISRNSPAA